MGTRALVYVMDDENKKPILRVHIQYDGYPDGIILDSLRKLRRKRNLVNGYTDPIRDINGMGNFASMLMWALVEASNEHLRPALRGKKRKRIPRVPLAGNIYVRWDSNDSYEYTYVFYPDWSCYPGWVKVKVFRGYIRDPVNSDATPIYDGTIDDYVETHSRS